MKLNADDIDAIKHAILHLEANKILDDAGVGGGWYTGNKESFKAKHRNALDRLRMLVRSTPSTGREEPLDRGMIANVPIERSARRGAASP